MMSRFVDSNLALAVGVVSSWGLLTAVLTAVMGRGPAPVRRQSGQPRFESVADASKRDDAADVR